jgi:hypothetical protein
MPTHKKISTRPVEDPVDILGYIRLV